MINTTEFNTRLKKILDYYGLSASAFAEIITVQRSSISHILSGRNKPSLEFITKVLHAFPDIDLAWILSGSGEFPKKTTVLLDGVGIFRLPQFLESFSRPKCFGVVANSRSLWENSS